MPKLLFAYLYFLFQSTSNLLVDGWGSSSTRPLGLFFPRGLLQFVILNYCDLIWWVKGKLVMLVSNFCSDPHKVTWTASFSRESSVESCHCHRFCVNPKVPMFCALNGSRTRDFFPRTSRRPRKLDFPTFCYVFRFRWGRGGGGGGGGRGLQTG